MLGYLSLAMEYDPLLIETLEYYYERASSGGIEYWALKEEYLPLNWPRTYIIGSLWVPATNPLVFSTTNLDTQQTNGAIDLPSIRLRGRFLSQG